jgi:hypothetical protein
MNHLNHVEEITPRAAEIYGQDYAKLDAPAKQIYYETIRATARLGGQTALEKACGQAINEFYTGELTPDVYSKEAEEATEDGPDTAPLPEAPKPKRNKKR